MIKSNKSTKYQKAFHLNFHEYRKLSHEINYLKQQHVKRVKNIKDDITEIRLWKGEIRKSTGNHIFSTVNIYIFGYFIKVWAPNCISPCLLFCSSMISVLHDGLVELLFVQAWSSCQCGRWRRDQNLIETCAFVLPKKPYHKGLERRSENRTDLLQKIPMEKFRHFVHWNFFVQIQWILLSFFQALRHSDN